MLIAVLRRLCVPFLVVAVAVALLALSSGDTKANPWIPGTPQFDPTFDVKLCNDLAMDYSVWGPGLLFGAGGDCTPDNTASANADVTTTFNIPQGHFNYNQGYFVTGIPDSQVAPDAAIPDGSLAGALESTVSLGLLNTPCDNTKWPEFVWWEATADNSPANVIQVQAEGTSDRFSTLMDTDGNDIYQFPQDDNDPWTGTADRDSDIVHEYPSTINQLFDPDMDGIDTDGNPATYWDQPVKPYARYAGATQVPPQGDWQILQNVIFAPGDLERAFSANKNSSYSPFAKLPGDNATVNLGYIHVIVLNDPTAKLSSLSSISDFCTELATLGMVLGKAYDMDANESGGVADGTCSDGEDNGADGPKVEDGKLDANGDTVIDGNDDGILMLPGGAADAGVSGIEMINGEVDADGDTNIDVDDDIAEWLGGRPGAGAPGNIIGSKVIDGRLDLNNDNNIDGDDDGTLGDAVDPDCRIVRGTSPTAGSHLAFARTQSFRDADGDGLENYLDTCPFLANTAAEDPYHVAGPGPDTDMIDSVCDPTDDVNTNGFDHDLDIYQNAQDYCPLVQSGPAGPPTQTHSDSELGNTYNAAAPDGGPKGDQIADLCDTADLVADGDYFNVMYIDSVCIGGIDLDRDGWCADDGDKNPYDGDDCASPARLLAGGCLPGEDTDVDTYNNPAATEDPLSATPGPCNDGKDNDTDGLADQWDPDCNPNVRIPGGTMSNLHPDVGDDDADDNDTVVASQKEDGDDTPDAGPPAQCADGLDNDLDGTDITDPDCWDRIDNDGDTKIDEDPVNSRDNDGDQNEDGTVDPAWGGQCSDSLDNDLDGTDTNDAECTTGVAVDEDPCDTLDNDGDTLIDEDPNTDDDDCDTLIDEDPAEVNATLQEDGDNLPTAGPPAECGDGLDNDGDTLFDGADPDCSDQTDNDGDTVADEDPVGGTGVDNDGDQNENGTVGTPGDNQCTDTLDNDGDGTDANDADCTGGPAVDEDDIDWDAGNQEDGDNQPDQGPPAQCGDGLDNDLDATDGADLDCRGSLYKLANSDQEWTVGTDVLNQCPLIKGHDTWPPDLTTDGKSNILDITKLTPPVFGAEPPNPLYVVRKDLTGNGKINILDITKMTPPVFGKKCTE